MNSLKKALTKDDVKRYKEKHIQPGNMIKISQHSTSNRNNWTDINQFIECRSTYQKSTGQAFNEKVRSLTRKSFEQGQLIVSSDILVKSLLSIFDQYYSDQQFDHSRTTFNCKEQKIINLLQILEKILHLEQKINSVKKDRQSRNFVHEIQISIQMTKKYLENQAAKRKQKQLNQYKKIIGMLKPTKIKPEKKDIKRENLQKLNNKLLHSLSSGNIHIKVTTQEISIQNENEKPVQRKISSKKSEGNLFRIDSDKKLKLSKNQGQIKLSHFLKDSSFKIVKTKVQYDYNAILQGSKSNIQYRNKTFHADMNGKIAQSEVQSTKKNNFEVTNINKAKKDQAFVFYRPKVNKAGK